MFLKLDITLAGRLGHKQDSYKSRSCDALISGDNTLKKT